MNEEYAILESDLAPDMLELYEAACAVREYAYAPYSGFRVGAALRTEDGRLYTGVNVENASFPVTICAERGALMKAVADGARKFSSMAVVTDAAEPAAPCGMCRQMLVEFGLDLQVLTAGRGGPSALLPLTELLPLAFVRSSFELRSLVMPALTKQTDR